MCVIRGTRAVAQQSRQVVTRARLVESLTWSASYHRG